MENANIISAALLKPPYRENDRIDSTIPISMLLDVARPEPSLRSDFT
jgi:hypothetical protein